MRVMVVVVVCTVMGCSTSKTDPLGECASGVECGTGCCANAAEVCVSDPTTNQLGCAPSCVSSGDCSTGCCAPLVDGSGNLVGPYVCQDSNVCCNARICPGSTCCVTDGNDNEFCAQPCTDQSACSGDTTCQTFDFSHTTCDGPKACGP
jgi:hypothetical protein